MDGRPQSEGNRKSMDQFQLCFERGWESNLKSGRGNQQGKINDFEYRQYGHKKSTGQGKVLKDSWIRVEELLEIKFWYEKNDHW